MHKTKKLAALLLSLIMVFSVLPTVALATGDLAISIDNKEIRAGESTVITVRVTENSGFMYLKLKCEYDESVMSITAENGDVSIESFTNSMPYFLWDSSTDIAKTGVLLKLNVFVKSTATAGTYPITFEKENVECSNSNEEDIDVFIEAGSIVVSHTHKYGTAWKNDGTNHWHECACGDKADMEAHTYGEWKVTTPATETTPGEKEHICTVCGYKETAEIPVLIHTHKYGTAWKNDGTSHWHECACGDKADMEAHTYGEWKVTTPATETTPGEKEHICTVCGYKETAEIPVLIHTHKYGTAWKNDGTSHWHECACGDKADMEAHTYGEWKVTTPATETTPGEKEHICTACGYKEAAEIPVLIHTHKYGTAWKNDGTNHWHECACGDKADVAAHVYDNADDTDCNICGYNRTIPTYAVTIKNWGTNSYGAGSYKEGTTVTVNAGTKTGYTFNGWTASNGVTLADSSSAETTFVMPAKAVTLAVKWKSTSTSGGGGGSSTPTYKPTVVESVGGSAAVTPANPQKGDQVTITPKPAEGKEVDKVVVTDVSGKEIAIIKNSNGTYMFTQPSGKVTVKVTYKDVKRSNPAEQFVDGVSSAWYHDAVNYVVEHGLMSGYSDNAFRPNAILTRAQLAQILYNQAGRPAAGMSNFVDVSADAWYNDAVAWAVQNGVVGGYGDGTFRPNAPITREQFTVMLWRNSGSPKSSQELHQFTDETAISDYAQEALAWAVENGIVNGYSDGRLNPKGTATRAQTAQILMNLLEQS